MYERAECCPYAGFFFIIRRYKVALSGNTEYSGDVFYQYNAFLVLKRFKEAIP